MLSQVIKDGLTVNYTSCLLLEWLQLSVLPVTCLATQHGGSGGLLYVQ